MKDFNVTGEVTQRIQAIDAMDASGRFRALNPGSLVTNVEEIIPPKPLDRDELVRMVRLLKASLDQGRRPGIVAENLLARFRATERE